VSGRVELADLRVDLRRAGGIVHVPKVVFSFDVVRVVSNELVLVGEFKDDGEEAKELDYHF
jgi:hypothetical protein